MQECSGRAHSRVRAGSPADPDVLAFIDGEKRKRYVVFGLPDTRVRALPVNVERVSHRFRRTQEAPARLLSLAASQRLAARPARAQCLSAKRPISPYRSASSGAIPRKPPCPAASHT